MSYWNLADGDGYDEYGESPLRRLWFGRELSQRTSVYSFEAPEPDPDEDPFARVEAQAANELEARARARRQAELYEQAAVEEVFAEMLADIRELPEVTA